MKEKFGIKTRVFISFSVFIIFVINVFSYILYFFTIESFRKEIESNISSQANIIKSFIDSETSNILVLPNDKVKEINSLGLFFYIGKDNNASEYLEGINLYDDDLIFKEFYQNYTIIIGKDITDLNKSKEIFIKITILLNILSLFFTLIISYIITDIVLKPLKKLSNFFSHFDIYKKQEFITDNYGESEIGKLNKAINKFIYDIKNIFDAQKSFIQDSSHELKTPLMQIESNLDLIDQKSLSKKDENRIEQIKNSVNNINEIISNISFILRGDKSIIKKEEIDIKLYFEEFIKRYEQLSKQKDIKINIRCINNFILETNKYYLDRLFGNIISNSIYYNEGNNEIEIIIEKDKVTISDKGIGIGKEDLSKIFNRFYRSKNSGVYSQDGNGLGLSIVKKICDIFNRKIEMESEKGEGTKMIIYFLIASLRSK